MPRPQDVPLPPGRGRVEWVNRYEMRFEIDFANAVIGKQVVDFVVDEQTFRDEIRAIARSEPAPRWIVVAAEPITDVDTTAADMLLALDRMLDERGQTLVFAELKDPVRRKIERYGLAEKIEPQHFFPTVDAAVQAFRARTGATWSAEATTPGPAVIPEPATPLPAPPPRSEHPA